LLQFGADAAILLPKTHKNKCLLNDDRFPDGTPPPVDSSNGDMREGDNALFRTINGVEWWLTRAYIGWSF